MTLAVVRSRALDGLRAPEVHVVVQLAPGLPSFMLVGLADTEVKDSRERVRAALQQSGFAFPHNKTRTVNLAPADLPKESGRFDLPIALGILAAEGHLDAARLDACEFAGELSLADKLRPVRGAVALALGAHRDAPGRHLVLPAASAVLAARVDGVDVRVATHLLQVVASLRPRADGGSEGDSECGPDDDLPRAQPADPPPRPAPPDLREVKGQAGAKRALEVAAAGSHSLLFVGPPGTGKSMLAQRLAGLLPAMAEDEALAASGLGDTGFGQRPLREPHHSASAPALVGGGSPPRPGEVSLAHGGVLFLDELPEFPRHALEALREPLESGRITISRAARQAQFPARFQLIAATNPCPCGWLGAFAATGRNCRCTPDAVARYQGRLSGPLLDRIDLQVEVPAARPAELLAQPEAETSAAVADRVAGARDRAQRRQGHANAELEPAQLDTLAAPAPEALAFLRSAAEHLRWSGRGLHRALKVARTIADLASRDTIAVAHVAEALQFRRGVIGPGG